MNQGDALIIFAKAPVPGLVKTRLIPHLSAEECARLHSNFIIDTVKLSFKIGRATTFLYCHPDNKHPFFQQLSRNYDIRLEVQKGRDLGERMDNAIRGALGSGYRKALIIGSDSPDLPPGYIEDAFNKLDSTDMVIGPASDGGYYLIGSKREIPVFSNIPWSSEKVFELTLKKAGVQGINYAVIEEWYDIDTWEDLGRLRKTGYMIYGRYP